MSLPSTTKIINDSKITFTEQDRNININANVRLHNKPENTILVKMSGTHKQKIGSYNATVEIV
jgi:hypothetical protein